MTTLAATSQRAPFKLPDGKGPFNDDENLFYAQQYGIIDQKAVATIKTARMIALFGAGEKRPVEHGKDCYLWRFEYKTAALRVETPRVGIKKLSAIHVEKDVPIPTLADAQIHGDHVVEFVRLLLEAVNAPATVP
jgi:hypothetical protein